MKAEKLDIPEEGDLDQAAGPKVKKESSAWQSVLSKEVPVLLLALSASVNSATRSLSNCG